MRKLIVLTALAIICSITPSFAATYYARIDGGTASQCNGVSDKPYTPVVSDVTKDCAYNHPFWSLPPGSAATKFVGGDTLIVGPGDYNMGVGAPNATDTGVCHNAWPWSCWMKKIPSGTAATPTRILGKGWDTLAGTKPRFVGVERSDKIVNLNGSSNVEIQFIEITDGSECILQGPAGTACKRTDDGSSQGPWAVRGIEASDSSNVLIKNVYIHGLYAGIHAARLSNWKLENTDILNNSFVGWNGDLGKTTSSNTGTITFKNVRIKGSGCGERLNKTIYSCYSQDQGGYGDGLGTEATGGDWVFDGVDISENVSDGVDLLYHNGAGKITITNSKFERNAGNQVKTGTSADIIASTLNGDCAWFKGKAFTSTISTAGGSVAFNNCRAGGDVLAAMFKPGTKVRISGGTQFLSIMNIGIMTGGASCNGTEVMSAEDNTTFELKPKFFDPASTSVKYYASGATGNGDGPCGTLKLTTVAGTTPPPVCVTDNSCTAPTPGCGQTTMGVDNCGTLCTRQGAPCACVSDGSCTAAVPACGQTTTGVDNCNTPCTRTGAACACVNDLTKCNAASPNPGSVTSGSDNCGKKCYKTGFKTVINSYVTPVKTSTQ